MSTLLVNRIKKWILFAAIGCSAYFVGYYLGHKEPKPVAASENRKNIIPSVEKK